MSNLVKSGPFSIPVTNHPFPSITAFTAAANAAAYTFAIDTQKLVVDGTPSEDAVITLAAGAADGQRISIENAMTGINTLTTAPVRVVAAGVVDGKGALQLVILPFGAVLQGQELDLIWNSTTSAWVFDQIKATKSKAFTAMGGRTIFNTDGGVAIGPGSVETTQVGGTPGVAIGKDCSAEYGGVAVGRNVNCLGGAIMMGSFDTVTINGAPESTTFHGNANIGSSSGWYARTLDSYVLSAVLGRVVPDDTVSLELTTDGLAATGSNRIYLGLGVDDEGAMSHKDRFISIRATIFAMSNISGTRLFARMIREFSIYAIGGVSFNSAAAIAGSPSPIIDTIGTDMLDANMAAIGFSPAFFTIGVSADQRYLSIKAQGLLAAFAAALTWRAHLDIKVSRL